jgi:hypothetical protein
VEPQADDITADMEITELNRRDVPVVRFNPADIGENLAVPAHFGTWPPPVALPPRVQLRFQDGEPARDGTLTGIRTRICTESSLYMGTVTAW